MTESELNSSKQELSLASHLDALCKQVQEMIDFLEKAERDLERYRQDIQLKP